MKSLPPVQEGVSSDELKLACLRVGSAYYALDIMGIREIIYPLPIVQVPRAPIYIDGVITLRKAVVPIVDLRRRFGVESREESHERIVVCAVDGRIIGLVVDEVSEVATFSRDGIQSAPYYMADQDNEFFPGVCSHKGNLLLLINLRKILSSDRRIDADLIQRQAFEATTKD